MSGRDFLEPAMSPAIEGVCIGELIGFAGDGARPLVVYPRQPGDAALAARTIVDVRGMHIGREVLLMFEANDPARPIIIGCLQTDEAWPLDTVPAEVEVDADGRRLVVVAKEEIVLRCGQASITLTKAGKVLINGTYVSSRSSGVNRIKGRLGATQLIFLLPDLTDMGAENRVILPILDQHIEDAACLRNVRTSLVRAPHVRLKHLARLDERIVAHLDGIAIAGRVGAQMSLRALDRTACGELFTVAVGCIEARAEKALLRLIALAEAVPHAAHGLYSAFGWVSASRLQETVGMWLASGVPAVRRAGIVACALHRADPKRFLDACIASDDTTLRERSLRCAGEVGRVDLLAACIDHLDDADDACRFQAARAALLLGDRGASLAALKALAPAHAEAAALAASALPSPHVHPLLEAIAARQPDKRLLIRTMGHAGDPHYIPWLIGHMSDDRLAQLAGESFSFITGADLARLDLDREPPQALPANPADDPADTGVAMDEDEGAPWPDADKIAQWWQANAPRFREGERHLCGAAPAKTQCIGVLKDGYQRQRMAAARHLCLIEPGRALFNCAAPSRRQERLLRTAA